MYLVFSLVGGRVSDPLFLSSSLALHFSDYSFRVHHPVNRDDRQWPLTSQLQKNDSCFFQRYTTLAKRGHGFNARSSFLLIVAISGLYNLPRFFEFSPTYSVSYVCPGIKLFVSSMKVHIGRFLLLPSD
jgi:hypothetical protein